MRSLWLTLLALTAVSRLPADGDLRGRVLDPVTCETEPAQRYVLYIPTSYSADKAWPAIFCFDASARGRIPVERLQAAAERYGYIVAGSLNSRNGPWADNAVAVQAMMRDVSAHLSLDFRRIYTAGVSGGARVATGIALSGTAKGVIACAAGFPALPGGVPARVPFAFFGTTGTEDFNHGEMVRLDAELESRNAAHRLVIFSGGHEWASAAVMAEAVAWLELQAMRTGAQPRRDEFIQAELRRRQEQIPSATGAERWRQLKALVADFDGLADVAGFRAEAATLAGSREVRADLKAEYNLARREADLLAALGDAALAGAPERHRIATRLRAQAAAPDDTPERQMVRRAIAGFCSMARNTAREMNTSDEEESAEGLRALAAELRPDPPPREEIVQLPVMRVSAALAHVQVRPCYLPNARADLASAEPHRLSHLQIESVRPGTAADRAGLRPYLEITAVQGVRLRGLEDDDLNRVLARPAGKEIILTVRDSADGRERAVHVVLDR